MEAVAQAYFVQEEIRTGKFQFFTQRDQCLTLALQDIPVNTGKVFSETDGVSGIVFYFRNQRVEAVEQKMKYNLSPDTLEWRQITAKRKASYINMICCFNIEVICPFNWLALMGFDI